MVQEGRLCKVPGRAQSGGKQPRGLRLWADAGFFQVLGRICSHSSRSHIPLGSTLTLHHCFLSQGEGGMEIWKSLQRAALLSVSREAIMLSFQTSTHINRSPKSEVFQFYTLHAFFLCFFENRLAKTAAFNYLPALEVQ